MKFVRHGQSEFNLHYTATGQDPGIEDAPLTEMGRQQAAEAAEKLQGHGFERILVSPYTRALQTAHIINEVLGLPMVIEESIREWGAFSCDIGTHRDRLSELWPHLDFGHLDPVWWPELENGNDVDLRAELFWDAYGDHPDRDGLLCVSHWGFIRALTGIPVPNCAIVHIERDRSAKVLHG